MSAMMCEFSLTCLFRGFLKGNMFLFKHLLLKRTEKKEEKDKVIYIEKTLKYGIEADIERSYRIGPAWFFMHLGTRLGVAEEKELITYCRLK